MQLIQLQEHIWLIYTDIEAGLKTLSAMKTQVSAFRHIVAGHGEIYTSTEQAKRVIKYTITQLESILDQVRAVLANGDAPPATDILKCSCAWARCYDYSTTTIRTFYNNTNVQAALSILYARGEISPLFQDNMLLWQRVEKG